MKVLSLVLGGLAISASAFAGEADQTVINAITVCPAANNPLTALKKARGNSITGAEFTKEGETSVTAMVVYDPRLNNPLIGAPTRLLGSLDIKMDYPAPGYGLKCTVKFRPLETNRQ